MKKHIFILVYLFTTYSSLSQVTLTLKWTMLEPEVGNEGSQIFTDTAGNPCVCGGTYNLDSITGYMAVKYDSEGDLLWKNQFDEIGQDIYTDCVKDSSNAVIIGGRSTSEPSSDWTIVLIKYNEEGDEEWRYAYDAPPNESVLLSDLIVDKYNNIYVVGRTSDIFSSKDLLIVKIDSFGNKIWEQRIEDTGLIGFGGWKGRVLHDKIMILGTTTSPTYFILQLDLDGQITLMSENIYSDDFLNASIFDSFGNLIIGDKNQGYKISKVNPKGDTLWSLEKPYIGNAGGMNFIDDEHGNIFVTGFHGDSTSIDFLTMKLDSSGNILWETRFDYKDKGIIDSPNDIVMDADYIYVAGVSVLDSNNWDITLVVYSRETGEEIISTHYDHNGNLFDDVQSITILGNAIYLSGKTGNGSQFPSYLITQKYLLDIKSSSIDQVRLSEKIDVFPNPTKGLVKIKFLKPISQPVIFTLINSQGKSIFKKMLPKGQTQYSLSFPNNQFGLFYYMIEEKGKGKIKSGKLVRILN